jgi:intracellular septation protein
MQNLLNFMPLLAFVVAYKLRDIYFATAVLMAAMLLLCLIEWLRTRTVSPMQLLSTALVLVFGTATLLLRDPRFLKWKPTIFMWLMAVAFLISQWTGKAPLSQRMLQPAIPGSEDLPRAIWVRLNLQWIACYLLLGFANWWVAFHASESTWVNFKVFGLTTALMLFAGAQAWWLSSRTVSPT